MMCLCLSLTSLSMIISKFIYFDVNDTSFLWLSHIHIYVCVCVYIYVHIYNIFLPIHLLMECLCCFHVLVIIDSAAVNIGVHVPF